MTAVEFVPHHEHHTGRQVQDFGRRLLRLLAPGRRGGTTPDPEVAAQLERISEAAPQGQRVEFGPRNFEQDVHDLTEQYKELPGSPLFVALPTVELGETLASQALTPEYYSRVIEALKTLVDDKTTTVPELIQRARSTLREIWEGSPPQVHEQPGGRQIKTPGHEGLHRLTGVVLGAKAFGQAGRRVPPSDLHSLTMTRQAVERLLRANAILTTEEQTN